MNADFAQRIGRPDLAVAPVDFYGGTSGNVQAGIGMSGADVEATAGGRLTAGVMVVLLVGVVALYAWTRGLQA